MNRKPRDYSHEYKPIEPKNITVRELTDLTFAEMMLKANGVPKKEKEDEEETNQP
jgi:hypothetical protein